MPPVQGSFPPDDRQEHEQGQQAYRDEQADNATTPPQAATSDWHEHASFNIAFDYAHTSGGMIWQTRAYHEESDERSVWSGIAGRTLLAWMGERAGLSAEMLAATAPGMPPETLIDELIDERTALMSQANEERDDLEAIDGIGRATAAALYRIGISRFADLTRYTSMTLSRELRERANLKVSPRLIEEKNWIGLARELALQAGQPLPAPSEETASAEARPLAQGGQRQHAGFAIYFDRLIDEKSGAEVWQTKLYHDETEEETTLQGTDPALWTSWILERARLPQSAEPPPDAAAPMRKAPPAATSATSGGETVYTSLAEEETELEILDVEITEVERIFPGEMKRLAAEVRFHMAGPIATTLTDEQIPCLFDIQTLDIHSGRSKRVVFEQQLLSQHEGEMVSRLTFPLPEVGRHELHTTVRVLKDHEMVAFFEGPVINVVA